MHDNVANPFCLLSIMKILPRDKFICFASAYIERDGGLIPLPEIMKLITAS